MPTVRRCLFASLALAFVGTGVSIGSAQDDQALPKPLSKAERKSVKRDVSEMRELLESIAAVGIPKVLVLEYEKALPQFEALRQRRGFRMEKNLKRAFMEATARYREAQASENQNLQADAGEPWRDGQDELKRLLSGFSWTETGEGKKGKKEPMPDLRSNPADSPVCSHYKRQMRETCSGENASVNPACGIYEQQVRDACN